MYFFIVCFCSFGSFVGVTIHMFQFIILWYWLQQPDLARATCEFITRPPHHTSLQTATGLALLRQWNLTAFVLGIKYHRYLEWSTSCAVIFRLNRYQHLMNKTNSTLVDLYNYLGTPICTIFYIVTIYFTSNSIDLKNEIKVYMIITMYSICSIIFREYVGHIGQLID